MPRKSEKHDAISFNVSTSSTSKHVASSSLPPTASDGEAPIMKSTAVSLTSINITSPIDSSDTLPAGQAHAETEKPELFSLQSLLEQQPEEPDWVVPGLLPTGVSLLAGPAMVDKPLLANQLGLSVAMGLSFLDSFSVCQGRVLYLALAEDFQQVRGRAVRLLRSQDHPSDFIQNHPADFIVARKWSPLRASGLADLEDTIALLDGLRLIIVDPLESLLPVPQSPTYRMRHLILPASEPGFFLPLRELAMRYRLAILLLHHLPEDWPTRTDVLAGSSPTGLTPASACNLLLTPTVGSTSSILHIAGPQVEERRLSLAFDTECGQWRCTE